MTDGEALYAMLNQFPIFGDMIRLGRGPFAVMMRI